MTTPDPNAPATEPDTTVGGGNPDPASGVVNQPYETPPDAAGPPVHGTRETDDVSGGTVGSGIGRVGDTDSHVADPKVLDDTTQGGGFTISGDVGDTDSHTHDPNVAPPDTTIGGGGINTTANPAYRTNLPLPSAEEKDTTTTFGGTGGEVSGSPDTTVIGTGTNPNAAEPGLTNSAYNVGGTKDTTYLGSVYGGNAPANDGTPAAAPTGVTAVLITGRPAATVSWTPPANAAATKVTRYVIESNTLGTQEAPANATSVEFEQGLIPGETYTFTVYAQTTQGSGRRSAPSAALFIPSNRNLVADTILDDGLAPNNPVGAPSQVTPAPVATAGAAASKQITITWTTPASNGNSAITGYSIVPYVGGVAQAAIPVGVVLTYTYTSALAGNSDYFTVAAVNAVGTGTPSAHSNTVVAP